MKLSEVVLRVKRVHESFKFVGFDGLGRAIFIGRNGDVFVPDTVVAKVELLEPEQPPSG